MKFVFAKVFLVLLDLLAMAFSILLAYLLRALLDDFFVQDHPQNLHVYVTFWLVYAVTAILFAYEGLYHRRYDFWHESRLVLKALLFSFIIVLAYLALTKTIQEYSRAVIVMAFMLMGFFVPLFKNLGKKFLFHIGLWQREAQVYGNDPFIIEEIFGNPYLGYVQAASGNPRTVFINSRAVDVDELQQIVDAELAKRHEVVFIPLLDEYDLTQSYIYELANTRTNLVLVQNRLKSRYRVLLKQASDVLMFLAAFPFLLPVLGLIAYRIWREEPGGAILFKQERMGKGDAVFVCYKFRTMTENGEEILRRYLREHPEEVAYYDTYHKYRNDPRVTKIGALLRRTSLDELPQVFNVLKGDMSFVGPRPYMLNEREKIAERIDTVLAVKPGITGLWQVSGRSEIDFQERVNLDVWYIRNWNLWMDVVILFKTVKAVVFKTGAH